MDGARLLVWPHETETVRPDDNDQLAGEGARALLRGDDRQANVKADPDSAPHRRQLLNLADTHDGTLRETAAWEAWLALRSSCI